jgi:hypothetical protein
MDTIVDSTSPFIHYGLSATRFFCHQMLRYTYTGEDPLDMFTPSSDCFTTEEMFQAYGDYYNLVTFSKSYHATDPRDKVYAFLGFRIVPGLIPDYSIPVQTLYTEYASRYITTWLEASRKPSAHPGKRERHSRRILTLLYNAGTMSQSLLGLPSWVPDLSVDNYTKPFWPDCFNCQCKHHCHRIYYAGLSEELAHVELLGGSRLRIPAKYVDVIREAGVAEFKIPPPSLSPKASTITKSLNTWMLESRMIAQRGATIYPVYPTGQSMQDAFKRTVIANRSYQGYDATNKEVAQTHSHLEYLFSHPRKLDLIFKMKGIFRSANEDFISEDVNILYLYRTITSVAHGRVFLRTDKGYYGVAPRGIRTGDCVFILPGGYTPVVLRPTGHSLEGPEFQLLGECYVHGFMKGEAMHNKAIPVEEVVLR